MSTNLKDHDTEKIISTKRRFVLLAESPLAVLRSRVSAQFGKSLDYLPGSTVRGAFAEVFLNKKGSDDSVFQAIFVQGKIRFHDFWPTFGSEPPVLLPLSASACKRYKLNHTGSLHDRLIETMISSDSTKKECPDCGGVLDRMAGYVEIQDDKVMLIAPQRQLRMHVGISRARGAAQHGQLFSYDMLTEKHLEETATKNGKPEDGDRKQKKLQFVGVLEGVSEDAETLFDELAKVIPDREHVSVGKARTRGLGELSIQKRQELSDKNDFDDRWRKFNQALQNRNSSDEYCYFSITLKSHLILRDALGRPVLDALGTNNDPLSQSLPQSERIAAFLNRCMVSGWNAAQGLPKPDVPALARGSVLGFRAKKGDEKALKEQLRLLENTGLGDRRAEGFGQISVCDSFHVNFA